MKKVAKLKRALLYSSLAALAFIYTFPVFWVILMSFKRTVDAFAIPPKWIFQPTLDHYIYVLAEKSVLPFLENSLVICTSTSILATLLGALAAYAFARYRSRVAFGTLLGLLPIRMFPYMLITIPLFIMAIRLGLYDTHIFLTLVYTPFNIVFATWMLRGFIKMVPVELEDAAKIDGCSELEVFWRIIFPNILSGLAATFLVVFLLSWNEYYIFALILTSHSAKPLTIALAEFQAAELIQYWSWTSAIVTISIIPAILLIVLLQKYLLIGFTFGLGEEKKS
jgi:multiple sugar transport system permease protein